MRGPRRKLQCNLLGLACIVAAGLIAAPALADEGSWGIAVFSSEDAFLGSHWAEGDSALVGSDAGCDLVLEGLEARHARFTFVEGQLVVIPLQASVIVNGSAEDNITVINSQDSLHIGDFRLQFFLPDPPPERRAEGEVPTAYTAREAGQAAAQARQEEFTKKAYQFCHDADYGTRGVVAKDLCVIADAEAIEVCPQLAHCAEWTDVPPNWRFGRVSQNPNARPRRVARRRPLIELPKLPPMVGYLIIGALLAIVIFFFVRSLTKAGWEDDDFELDDPELSDAARKLQALPEARAQVLLRMAHRALSEKGDAAEAALLVHMAMLRHLDDEGLARYHPSKTNGDYLRAIRRHRELAGLFKRVVFETERLRFGDGQVDPRAVQSSLQDAQSILPAHRGARAGGIDLASPSLVLLLGLGLVSQSCGPTQGIQAYYNHAPAGMSALIPLLQSAGLSVQVSRDRLVDLPEDTGVLVLRTSALGEGHWPKDFKLDEQLDLGRNVIVIDDLARSSELLPSTSSVASGIKPQATDLLLHVNPYEPSCAYPLRDLLQDPDAPPVRLPEGRLILWDGVSETSTISQHPLVMRPFLKDRRRPDVKGHTAAYGWATHRVSGDEDLTGCLFVFADRDLFTNVSLTRPANAQFVAQMFTLLVPDDTSVVFADRLDQWTMSDGNNPFAGGGNGDGANPTEALKASNMLPFVVQALISLALLYIFLGAAFGPLRDAEQQSHKAFVEHAEAIGRQYHRTGKPGLTHSATSLAKYVVMRNRDRLRGGEGGGWAGLATELAEKHGLPEEDVRAALRLGIEGKSELGAPKPEDPEPSSARLLDTLTRLLGTHRRT